ncbi:MAG: protein translocase subunit SecD [Proteobacteria bacterium]|nr:protein translocase subunit SecD [Pseudomonadota bacterium]
MNIKGRLAISLVVVLAAIFFLMPHLKEDLPPWWSQYRVNLGLDLQGGMHLVLGVDQEEAVKGVMERLGDEIEESLSEKHIRLKRIKLEGYQTLKLSLLSESDLKETTETLAGDFPQLVMSSSTGGEITLSLSQSEIDFIKKFAVDQGIEVIRNRIDETGVNEPTIQRQGENRILVQLPGIKDPDRAIKLLQETAQLQFKLVDEDHDLERALKGRVPKGSEIAYKKVLEKGTGRVIKNTPFLLKKRTLMRGDRLTNARVRVDSQFNQPYISMDFDKKGGKQFERITGANIGKRLAIVLDNNVYSAPVIKSKISGGSAIIEGSFTMDEAHDLAIALRSGALPAPVEILENRTVGPSLGKDSIQKGFLSMLIGGVLVLLFMALYYKLSGLVADIVLILNILLVLGFLAALNATLTLPGIAGIVLTIGMAVDANVIIYERIREELRIGKTPLAALDSGFSKAFLPIMDANVTTLIAAVVLFEFGTGPVKGFAVTLSIGILSSLFTALFVSRVLFDFFLKGKKVTKLSI